MSTLPPQRMTAEIDGEFCVFLIGMRINRLWKVHRWFPMLSAMPAMLKELRAEPESGLLSVEMWFGNPSIAVQYWRSFAHLEQYARNPEKKHRPAWARFNRELGVGGDVGVWHETYVVGPGQHESVYVNMPAFGLGRAGRLRSVGAALDSAAQRRGAASG